MLTPMRNRAHESKAEHSGQSELAIERYFRLLQSLSYPRSLITVAILCGDSTDDTYAAATKYMEALQGQGYRRLLLLNKDFGCASPHRPLVLAGCSAQRLGCARRTLLTPRGCVCARCLCAVPAGKATRV